MEKTVDFYEQRFPAEIKKIVTPVRIENLGGTRFFEGVAMWDTGAEITTVPSCVAETLRLDTLPGGLMQTPTGDTPANVGAVLVFPGNVKRFVPVVTAVLGGANRKFDCIIGMDVIRQGDMMLLHDGEELVFRFNFGEKFSERR